MAQLNGFPSITAAAERAVTFGNCFYRWTARLLSCLGSSAAQGIGGRLIAAPTGGACLRRAGEDTRPYGGSWKLPLVWAGVCVPRGHPHPSGLTASPPTPFGLRPFPPDRGNRPSPLEGEGFRATARVAPTAKTGPEALARQSQAQGWNRISPNFPPAQAPSGAGRNRTQALLILRAGRILLASRGNPRKWGTGGKANMDTECPS